MRGNVASTTRVTILQPGSSNVGVFLVDDMFDVLAEFLDLVRHQDAGDAGAYGQDFELAVLRILSMSEY